MSLQSTTLAINNDLSLTRLQIKLQNVSSSSTCIFISIKGVDPFEKSHLRQMALKFIQLNTALDHKYILLSLYFHHPYTFSFFSASFWSLVLSLDSYIQRNMLCCYLVLEKLSRDMSWFKAMMLCRGTTLLPSATTTTTTRGWWWSIICRWQHIPTQQGDPSSSRHIALLAEPATRVLGVQGTLMENVYTLAIGSHSVSE